MRASKDGSSVVVVMTEREGQLFRDHFDCARDAVINECAFRDELSVAMWDLEIALEHLQLPELSA